MAKRLPTFTREERAAVVRFSSHDGPTEPQWGMAVPVTLIILRRDQEYRRGKTVYPAGSIVSVSVYGHSWAEYSMTDWDPISKEFMAEEYRMQVVLGWTPDETRETSVKVSHI